jgi:hypothetical protein
MYLHYIFGICNRFPDRLNEANLGDCMMLETTGRFAYLHIAQLYGRWGLVRLNGPDDYASNTRSQIKRDFERLDILQLASQGAFRRSDHRLDVQSN